MRKVNEAIREIVAEEVAVLGDPGIGFVTITGVDTAPDLRNATVYYSVLGSPEEQEATAAALGRARARLQAAVARQTHLRYTPRLAFAVDPAIETGLRVDALLRELADSEDDGAVADAD